ncbi:hypothetical protein D3C78_520730 [compost metagenome]
MHVGVEEAVAKHLGEEDLHATLGEQLHVGALVGQGRQVSDLDAVDALHHQHFRPAPVPVHLGHVHHLRAFEVALELAGVGRLAQQVEFVVDGFFVVVDHFHRVQQARIGRNPLGATGNQEQPGQVLGDDRLETGAHHLDHHLFTALELGRVHLGNRGRGQGLDVEAAKHFADLGPELLLDQGDGFLRVERRYPVLQQHQLVGNVFGQQVAASREQLAELDEDRPQVL